MAHESWRYGYYVLQHVLHPQRVATKRSNKKANRAKLFNVYYFVRNFGFSLRFAKNINVYSFEIKLKF